MTKLERAQEKRIKRVARHGSSFAQPREHPGRDEWQMRRAQRQAIAKARVDYVDALLAGRREQRRKAGQ